MNKSVKILAIVAGGMVAIGLILAGIGYLAGGNQTIHIGKNGFTLGNKNRTSENVEIYSLDLEAFKSIDVDLGIYDVDLIPGDKYYVECNYDSGCEKPSIKMENEKLVIRDDKQYNFSVNLDFFDININGVDDGMNVKIYYPENTKFEDVKISCNTSDLSFENINADEIDFDLDFGDMDITNITANKVDIHMNSGDCIISKIKAENFNLKNNFGRIVLEEAELKVLKAGANSGDISVTNTIADNAVFKLDFGRLNTNNFKTNGLEIDSSSGDVELNGTFLGDTDVQCNSGAVTLDTDVARDQYTYELNVDMGTVYISDDKMSSSSVAGFGATNNLKIHSNMGDIRVNFK